MTGRVFYSSISTETNGFSTLPTRLSEFQSGDYRTGKAVLYDEVGEPRGMTSLLQECFAPAGLDLVAGINADAAPAAPMPHAEYLVLKGELLDQLKAAMPVEAVMLSLHGAMQSDDCTDCEGDMLAAVRAIVGPAVPIGAVLDPHAHLTDQMVGAADILSFMKEYPHVDGHERIKDVASIILGMLDGSCTPVAEVVNCRTLGFYPTQNQPMRGLVDLMSEQEQDDEVLGISLVHGFPWGDVPEQGSQFLVYTNDRPDLARAIAEDFHERLWAIRDRTMFETITSAEMIALIRKGADEPLVFGDIADNPGGGASGDSTYLVRSLLDAGIQNAAVGLVYDPESVAAAHFAGPGTSTEMTIGGKCSFLSGDPVECSAEVVAVARDARMKVIDGVDFPMGDTAWVRVKGVNIILASEREQAYSPDVFAHLGLDPASMDVLVAKSTNHFTAFFADLSSQMYFVNSPGAISYDFAALPYRRFNENYYPLVDNPFESE